MKSNGSLPLCSLDPRSPCMPFINFVSVPWEKKKKKSSSLLDLWMLIQLNSAPIGTAYLEKFQNIKTSTEGYKTETS